MSKNITNRDDWFSECRWLLTDAPSAELWKRIITLWNRTRLPKDEKEVALSYLSSQFSHWPLQVVRLPPKTWIRPKKKLSPQKSMLLCNTIDVGALALPKDSLARLLRSENIQHIQRLQLAYTQDAVSFAPKNIQKMSPCKLKVLDLRDTNIDDEGLIAWLQTGALSELEELYLQVTKISDKSMEALFTTYPLAHLRVLDIRHTEITHRTAECISKAPLSRQLRALHMYANDVGEQGLMWLADAKNLQPTVRNIYRARYFAEKNPW